MAKVEAIVDLVYAKQSFGKVRWVLAAPESSPFHTVKDLEQDHRYRVGGYNRAHRAHGVTAKVEFSWGAMEVAAGVADATGGHRNRPPLRANKLKIIDTVIESIPSSSSIRVPERCEAAQLEDSPVADGAIAALGKGPDAERP